MAQSYEEFVEKFKPKKTTDDCYTPPEVYDVVRDWVCAEYGVNAADIVRPFYPGGDYESLQYPENAVVVDNPPFSIISKICKFYLNRNIPFFLFAPSLITLNICPMGVCHIFTNSEVVYENGAKVRTSFVTNMDGNTIAKTVPELAEALDRVISGLAKTKQLPKYVYPIHVLTSSNLNRFAKYKVEFAVQKCDCIMVKQLDEQKGTGKTIYGAGLLLSERAAAERAAAERAAAERAAAERENAQIWSLSEREKNIIASLGVREAAQ